MAKKKITIEDLAGMVKRSFDEIENLAGMVKRGFDDVYKRFDAVDKRFEQIDQQLEYITARVDVISHDTSDLPDMRQGLQDHEHRIVRLERKVSPR